MPDRVVYVSAPSRLHFGLLAFNNPDGRQFGGAGTMIAAPRLELSLTPAEHFSAAGPLGERAEEFARRWARFHGLDQPPTCRIETRAAGPQHVGLGVGTQLGLSVAAGLCAFTARPLPAPEELAQSVGRGLRSAVGTYGFRGGGLIADRGKLPGELIAPLASRVPLPATWRFVLIQPPEEPGLAGLAEQEAFDRLPAVPAEVTAQLWEEIERQLLPSAREEDLDRFSESVFRYGHLAGRCFAALQGGAYRGQRAGELVQLLRTWGVAGVGQSSWGPTLFALTRGDDEARELSARLSRHPLVAGCLLTCTAPDNQGATIDVQS